MGAGKQRLQALSTPDKFFSAGQVKFAHNVVEYKHGVLARSAFENFHFGKFYRKRRRPRLPLRSESLCVRAVYQNIQIVAVRAGSGKAEAYIPLVIGGKFVIKPAGKLLFVSLILLFGGNDSVLLFICL